jgi:hypothetical protein
MLTLSKVSKKKEKRFSSDTQWNPIRALGIRPTPRVPNFGVELEIGFEFKDERGLFVPAEFLSDVYCCEDCNGAKNEGAWRAKKTAFLAKNDCDKTYITEENYLYPETIKEIYDRVEGYAILHEDCGAMEIVSVPLPLDEIKIYLEILLEEPIPRQLPPEDDWGMHVHYSSRFMRGKHLERAMRFLHGKDDKMIDFMDFIAERDTNGPRWHYGTILEFQELVGILTYHRPNDSWLTRDTGVRSGVALNTYHGTHEFRFFRTTNDPAVACSNVEFVDALSECFRTDDTDLKGFLMYIANNADKYPYLFRRIKTGGWY